MSSAAEEISSREVKKQIDDDPGENYEPFLFPYSIRMQIIGNSGSGSDGFVI